VPRQAGTPATLSPTRPTRRSCRGGLGLELVEQTIRLAQRSFGDSARWSLRLISCGDSEGTRQLKRRIALGTGFRHRRSAPDRSESIPAIAPIRFVSCSRHWASSRRVGDSLCNERPAPRCEKARSAAADGPNSPTRGAGMLLCRGKGQLAKPFGELQSQFMVQTTLSRGGAPSLSCRVT
jgi:hypothetical protein